MISSSRALAILTACLAYYSTTVCADAPGVHELTPKNEQKGEPLPWFTGPLLTPSGHTIPNGHANIEPYEFVNTGFGSYDKHWHSHNNKNNFYNISTQIPMQIGVANHFDIFLVPGWSWNHIKGASHWDLNDIGAGFDYQILDTQKGKWWPTVKLNVGFNAPVGRYQKLNPHRKGTDIGGSGSWTPTVGIVSSHLYWLGGHYFFAPRLNIQYFVPTPVHVKNFNAYGGGHHTHGTVFPGQAFRVLFGFELALSQRWALAGDALYLHTNKTRFKGHKGVSQGVENSVGGPSSESFSIAPAIEYNWTPYYGIIAGAWFSIGGRQAAEFANGVVALNIYH